MKSDTSLNPVEGRETSSNPPSQSSREGVKDFSPTPPLQTSINRDGMNMALREPRGERMFVVAVQDAAHDVAHVAPHDLTYSVFSMQSLGKGSGKTVGKGTPGPDDAIEAGLC